MTATKTPQPERTRSPWVWVAIALVVAVVLVIGTLAAFVTFGRETDGQSEPVPAPTPSAALPDGEVFAFINEVGGAEITVDPALMLTGEQARAAAEADGVIAPGEDLPNDFYIQNADPGPLTVGVTDDAELVVLTFDASGSIVETPIALADLAEAFTGDYPGVAIYGLVAGEFPVTLTVEGGMVTGFTQAYLP